MKRFSKNLLSLLTADITRRLLGFVSVAYLARILGKDDFGVINIGFAVLAYSMVLSTAGFSVYGTKRIAQGAPPELIGKVIGSRMITTVSMLLILCLVALLTVQDSRLAYLIIVFSCAIIPQMFFLDWYFQGKEKMGIISAARILQAVVYLAVVLFFVHSSGDVIWVALGAITGELTASVLFYIHFRSTHPEVRLQLKPSLELLKQSVPLAVGIIIATLVMNYPTIALGIFCSTSDVGIYSVANKLVYSLMMGDRILLLLLIPASSRKHSQSPEALQEMLQDALKWILVMGLPIAVGGMLVADKLTVLFFGVQYAASAAVLKILIWYFVLTMLHTTYTSGLIAAGDEKTYGKIMIVTALVYLVCVSCGAYWYGPIGAAFSIVFAEGISVVLMNRSLRSSLTLNPPKKLLRIVLSTAFMAVCVSFSLEYGLIFAICVGAVSYSMALLLVRALNKNEIKTLTAKF
jgi:O-antigen/teichoic acid export membrane protein